MRGKKKKSDEEKREIKNSRAHSTPVGSCEVEWCIERVSGMQRKNKK